MSKCAGLNAKYYYFHILNSIRVLEIIILCGIIYTSQDVGVGLQKGNYAHRINSLRK